MLELRARYALLLLKLLLMFNNSFWKGVTGIMKNLILILGALFWLSACGGSKEEALGSAFFCSSYDTEPACIQDSCVWDPANKCLSKTLSSCSSATEATSCGELGCVWDPANKCLSSTKSLCSSATVTDSCGKLGCVWGSTSGCLSTNTGSCSSSTDATSCGELGCVWDTTTGCLSTKTGSCSSSTEATSCGELGCVWDPVNKCLDRTNSLCNLASIDTSCQGIKTCRWYTVDTTPLCLNYCNAYNIRTCSDQLGCELNEDNSCVDK